MKRGEIWTAAAGSGYVGKPRPVVIVQDDLFDATASVTVQSANCMAMRVANMPVSQPQPTPQPYPAPTPTQSAYQENFFDRFVTFLKDLFDVKTVSAAPLTVEAPVGEVYFLLGDHLGSTTMTLNAYLPPGFSC